MRTGTRKVLWGLLAVVVLSIVAAAIALRPYYRMPSESKDVLDQKLAEFQAEARKMEDRPMAAREALVALSDDLKPVFAGFGEKEKPNSAKCPPYDPQHLATLAPHFAELQPFAARYHALAHEPFELQQDMACEADIPNFYATRKMAIWELAATVVDMNAKRREEAMGRLASVANMNRSLATPPALLISVMVAISQNHELFATIAYLLPRLTPEEIAQLRGYLEELPDTRASLIAALKVEVVTMVSAVDRYRSGNVPNLAATEMISGENQWLRFAAKTARFTGYLTRERYYLLSLLEREVVAWESWLAAGGVTPRTSRR